MLEFATHIEGAGHPTGGVVQLGAARTTKSNLVALVLVRPTIAQVLQDIGTNQVGKVSKLDWWSSDSAMGFEALGYPELDERVARYAQTLSFAV